MRYFYALLCPPLAFLACKMRFRALVASALYALAIMTASNGLGVLVEFFLVLWAFRAVGDASADRESRAFVRTVKPIPFVRS